LIKWPHEVPIKNPKETEDLLEVVAEDAVEVEEMVKEVVAEVAVAAVVEEGEKMMKPHGPL